MNKCIFCQIVAGTTKAEIFTENESCLAIHPLELEVDDHLLVLPKTHHANLFELPNKLAAELIIFTQEITQSLINHTQYTGVNLLHASGVDAQQSVQHFHIHLLPRKQGDQIEAWPKLPGGQKTLLTSGPIYSLRQANTEKSVDRNTQTS